MSEAIDTKQVVITREEIAQFVLETARKKYGIEAKPQDIQYNLNSLDNLANLSRTMRGEKLLAFGATITIVETIPELPQIESADEIPVEEVAELFGLWSHNGKVAWYGPDVLGESGLELRLDPSGTAYTLAANYSKEEVQAKAREIKAAKESK
jgi:hypothetical protein